MANIRNANTHTVLFCNFFEFFDFHVYDLVFLGSLLGGDQILAIAIFDFDVPAGVLKVSKSRRPWVKAGMNVE